MFMRKGFHEKEILVVMFVVAMAITARAGNGCIETGPTTNYVCVSNAFLYMSPISVFNVAGTIYASATTSNKSGVANECLKYKCQRTRISPVPVTVTTISGYSVAGPHVSSGSGLQVSFPAPASGSGTITMWVTGTVDRCSVQPVHISRSASYPPAPTILTVAISPIWGVVPEGENSETLEAVVTPSIFGLDYQWSWGAPTGACNNPNVNFSNPTDPQTTVLNSHWYALPDDICNAGPASDYEITCTVSQNGQELCAASATLSVCLPIAGGITKPPSIVGRPDIAFDSGNNDYYVRSAAGLTRHMSEISYNISAQSEYHPKVEAHEQKHKEDYDNGFSGHNFFTVEEFYPRIANLRDSTKNGLLVKVMAAVDQYEEDEGMEINSVFGCLETRADQISDPMQPYYKYYNCGRYSCP